MKTSNYRALFFIAALLSFPLASFAEPGTRINISLDEPARAFVLKEMRGLLLGLQQMTAALASDDMETVAKAAKPLGMQMMRNVPKSLMQKLPKEFRKLGSSVHRDFDMIAQDAQDLEDSQHTLTQLSATLAKCVACHAIYQITAESNESR
ncbi:MAG: hypothetical protein DRR08_01735 [Candidatus Parabeggiatoa sp. nov. 2]|nr:MAG: hypothetical protein B6247_00245 [Beggiatoa sp. 4572_84]RKZ64095.1 MAG: hypothetical protein DRR08_01735 [Gammaproteobacteria bacterium]